MLALPALTFVYCCLVRQSPFRSAGFSVCENQRMNRPPACTYLSGCTYLISTTCTWCRCLVEEIGSEYRCLVEVECRCLVVQNSKESQAFVENIRRGAARPRARSAGDGRLEERDRPGRVRGSWDILEPDTGGYSTRRRCDGAMRGGEGESSNAAVTV